MVHKFLPNSVEETTAKMLNHLGLDRVDQLFKDIPDNLLIKRPLKIPNAMSEIELEQYVSDILSSNQSAPEYTSFLGGGVSLHHVPSIIDEILSRGEFYTAYTPYQPEISQGMLQCMFEYQSMICELTSMEVANSSMYDWGTALGEAGRMAARVTRRKKLLVAGNVSPERIAVLKTYCYPAGIETTNIGFDHNGEVEFSSLKDAIREDVAAVYFENPNFFGVIEEQVEEISQLAHKMGSLVIAGVNPLTLGVLKSPGEYSADIVVGDGQSLGLYPNFGGPLLGIFATLKDEKLLRQMPGRLIGLTSSKDGARAGYTMVLQTREQHIRREQATSNICTNEALLAIAVAVYLGSMGPQGMKEIGERIFANAHYAGKRLVIEGFEAPHFNGPFFNEFTIKTGFDSTSLSKKLLESRILGGLPLARFSTFYPKLKHVSLFSFAEQHTPQQIDDLVDSLVKLETEYNKRRS